MNRLGTWLRRKNPSLLTLAPLAFLCLGHGQGGCGEGEHEAHPHEHQESSGAVCPASGAPTAREFGQRFLETYCLSCHGVSVVGSSRGGAPTDINFDTLEDVRRWAEEIDLHAAAGPDTVNTAMPPAGLPQPTLEERLELGEWLACGAP
jgi:uncharacterized membrane protein